MCFVHVLLNSLDMKDKGYDVKLIMEGASVALLPKLSSLEKPIPDLWAKVQQEKILDAVCRACAYKLGSLEFAEKEGLPLSGDMKGHPPMSYYLENDYEIITF